VLPYTVAFHHATPHGVVTAVHIPDAPDPVPDEVLAQLPDPEAAHARTLRGYRQIEFAGGRIALRQACLQLGPAPAALLADDRGAPVLPAGLVGSISHKRGLAVAMAARVGQGTLGIDLEDYGPPRPSIAPRILTPEELAYVDALPDGRRWFAIVLRFSIKESIYKALDPYVRRYVGFHEARVEPDLHGAARVSLDLAHGEGPFDVDARYEWLRGRILTSVRIRRAAERGIRSGN
jgi:enterobactin synthetase component D